MSSPSKMQKKAALHEKLQQLRSVTHSTAVDKTSIMADASKYIEELKDKIGRLDQESSSHDQNSLSIEVKVETLENGFLIKVFYERNCPGLLVSVLEAFDELGLEVLDANASCSRNFHFEAIGGKNEEMEYGIDAQVVKQTVLKTIMRWRTDHEDNDEPY